MFARRSGLDIPAFGDAHLATRQEMEAAGLFAKKGIRLGYYRSSEDRKNWGEVIRYDGDGGLILVAPPRSGKARDVLVGALLEYDQSVIVVDPKGQLAAITKAQRERMGQRVVVLNPFNVWPEILGPTARYNPMALLDQSSPTFGAECRKLAEGLIARSSNERDSHWTDGARTLVASVIGHLVVAGDTEDKNLAQMREIIAGPEVLLLSFAQAAMHSPHAFIRQGLSEYAIENAPNKAEIAGKISTAREQTFFLGIDTIADNIKGDDFRFGILKNEPVTVYVILPDEHLDTCGKWFRLVVASALHDLWRGGRGAYRVLAILDEFAHIGHLDILEKAAGMAAGHGLQLWPVLQNLTQLKKDYGENWETFIAGSEIRQFFATRDQTSAKYVSETSGQRTVTTAGQSVHNTKPLERDQSSDSVGQAGQALIRPHEISGFGPNESLIFGPRNIVINALRQPYFHTPEFRSKRQLRSITPVSDARGEGIYSPDPQHKADATPPPPVSPETIITFADTHAAAVEEARKVRAAKRSLPLRLLTWGASANPVLNALRKIEFFLTFPLRLIAALITAPFALHNKPLGAALGFLALFGFWEVWDGFAKQPVLDVFKLEESTCMDEEFVANKTYTSHIMACRVEAIQVTAKFFWDNVLVALLKKGPKEAFADFDKAFGQEQALPLIEIQRRMDAFDGKKQIPLKGHTIRTDEEIRHQTELVETEKRRKAEEARREREADEAERRHDEEIQQEHERRTKEHEATRDRGYFTDPMTGLMWQANRWEGSQRDIFGSQTTNWSEAVTYCNNLVYVGYRDWRLPTLEEFEGLADPQSPTGYKGGVDRGDSGSHWSITQTPDHSKAWLYSSSGPYQSLSKTFAMDINRGNSAYSALCVRGESTAVVSARPSSPLPHSDEKKASKKVKRQ